MNNMVLKTGLDRIRSFRLDSVQTEIRPVKSVVRPACRINQTVSPNRPVQLFFFPLLPSPTIGKALPSSSSPIGRTPPFLECHPPTPRIGRRNENPEEWLGAVTYKEDWWWGVRRRDDQLICERRYDHLGSWLESQARRWVR